MDLLYDRVLEVLIAALLRFFCLRKQKKRFSSFPDADTRIVNGNSIALCPQREERDS